MKGLFEISNFNEAADDDILDMKINESAETEIPVPGGDKEQPGKAGIEIDEDTYNCAIDKLQQSFKEAAETMEMLRYAKIVESVEQTDVVADALYEYAMGPIFEKVEASDKEAVKKIVEDIKSDVSKICKENNAEFHSAKRVLKLLLSVGSFVPVVNALVMGDAVQGWTMLINSRAYQTLGMILMSEDDAKKLVDCINEKLADKLGEYKVVGWNLHYKTLSDIIFRKGLTRDRLEPFVLLVDKKIPAELDKAAKKLDDAIEKAEKKAEEEK